MTGETTRTAAAELPDRIPMSDPTDGKTHLWVSLAHAALTLPSWWISACSVMADPDVLTTPTHPNYPALPWCGYCWTSQMMSDLQDARTRACTRTWRPGGQL